MSPYWWEEKSKPKRKSIPETVWKATKAATGNKCIVCGKTEKQVGKLIKAHIKAHSKGGVQVLPMCAICHTKFDSGLLSDTQLKKIGMTRKDQAKVTPKKGKKKDTETKIPKWMQI